jgi:hypothetical protein
MNSKRIMLASLASILGVAVSLGSVASTAHATENPTPTVSGPTYNITATGPGESLNVRLNGAHAVRTGSQVAVIDSDERVIETLPETITLPNGQTGRMSYDVSDPNNVRVSLIHETTNPNMSGEEFVGSGAAEGFSEAWLQDYRRVRKLA